MSVLTQFIGGAARVWASGTPYLIGDVLLSPADNYQQYVRITNGAGTTDPASDTTNYRPYGARAIKSTQRGITLLSSGGTSVGATITSVVTAKTQLRLLGCRYNGVTNFQDVPYLQLTNSTTLTVFRTGAVGDVYISWELTEYY